MKEVKFTDDLPDIIVIVVVLENEDHEPRLQICKQKSKQEGLNYKQHQGFLIIEGIHKG